jgi:hypothetical protein
MPKIILILFALLLLCCGKDPQPKHCDSLCENEKIKAEYQKRFGVPITDIELSTTNIVYHNYKYKNDHPQISITKTATGAIAIYGNKELELELSTGEWLDFVNALYKYDISGWLRNNDSIIEYLGNKFKYDSNFAKHLKDGFKRSRILEITLSSETHKLTATEEYNIFKSADWKEFEKMIEDFEVRLIKEGTSKLEAKLKTEYEKRFGMPISGFELSTRGIDFSYYNEAPLIFRFSVTRATTGIFIEKYADNERTLRDIELDMEDWLDFINALRKSNVNEWEKEYRYKYKDTGILERWFLTIHSSYEDKLKFSGICGYPPNWDEFIKAIDDFVAKIIEKEKAENFRKN